MKKSFLPSPYFIISFNNASSSNGANVILPPVSFSVYSEFSNFLVSSNNSKLPVPPGITLPIAILLLTLFNVSFSLNIAALTNYSKGFSNVALPKGSISILPIPCLSIEVILGVFVIISANNTR